MQFQYDRAFIEASNIKGFLLNSSESTDIMSECHIVCVLRNLSNEYDDVSQPPEKPSNKTDIEKRIVAHVHQ